MFDNQRTTIRGEVGMKDDKFIFVDGTLDDIGQCRALIQR